MVKTKNKYVIGVSGGPDSMYLLNKYKNQDVVVCHVNYHKRKDSDLDQKLVKDFCHKYGIKIYILNVNNNIYKQYQKDNNNFQTIARNIRYDFFYDICKKENIKKILIGHNKDDFIETALIQKMRSTSLPFYGIKKQNKLWNFDTSIVVCRPILNLWKSDILSYCKKNNIPFRIDSTNDSPIYLRNKIRKSLSNTNKEAIFQKMMATNMLPQNKLINKVYSQWLNKDFSIKFYLSVKSSLKIKLLYIFLSKNNISNISKNKMELIDRYIMSKSNKLLRLGNNRYIVNKKGILNII